MAPITSQKKTKTKKTETKIQNKTTQQSRRNKDSPTPDTEAKVKEEPEDSDILSFPEFPMERLQRMKDCLERYKQYQEDNRLRLLKHRDTLRRLDQLGKLPKNKPFVFTEADLRSAPYKIPGTDCTSSVNFLGNYPDTVLTFPQCLTKAFFLKERELVLEIWKHCRRDLCLSALGSEFAKYCKPSSRKEEPKKYINYPFLKNSNICRLPPGFLKETKIFENSALARNDATIDIPHNLCDNRKTEALPKVHKHVTRRRKKKDLRDPNSDVVSTLDSSMDTAPKREYFNSNYLASNQALMPTEEDPDDEKYADCDWIDLLNIKPSINNEDISSTVDTASCRFPNTVDEDVLKEEFKNSTWAELVTASNYSFEDIASMFDTTPTILNTTKEDTQEKEFVETSEWIGLTTARHSTISDDGSLYNSSFNIPKEDTPKKEYFGNIPDIGSMHDLKVNTTEEGTKDKEYIPGRDSENKISDEGNEDLIDTEKQHTPTILNKNETDNTTFPIVEGNWYLVPDISHDSGKETYYLYDRKPADESANSVEQTPLRVIESFFVTPEPLTGNEDPELIHKIWDRKTREGVLHEVKCPSNGDPNATISSDDLTVQDMDTSQSTLINEPPSSEFDSEEDVAYFQMYLPEMDSDYTGSIKELMKSREVCMYAITNGFDNDSELQLLVLANSNIVYIYDIKKYKKKRLPEELRLVLQDNKIQKILHDARFLLQYFEERYHLKINNIYDIKAAAIVRTFRLRKERKADDVIMTMSTIFPDLKVLVPSISELREIIWFKRPIVQQTIDTLGSLCLFTIKFKEVVDEMIKLPPDSDSDE